MSIRTRVLIYAWLIHALGCAPGKFDDLARLQPVDAGNMLDAAEPNDAEQPNSAEPDAGDDPDADGCPDGLDPKPLLVPKKAQELARLSHPGAVAYRILGPTAFLGSERVWAFSTTALRDDAGTTPERTPSNYPSAARDGDMAPWSAAQPAPSFGLDDAVIAGGLPEPFLTLQEQELASDTLEVASIVRLAPPLQGGIAFVLRSPFFEPAKEVWTAQIEDGALRGVRPGSPLFKRPDPMFGLAANRGATYVKLLACQQAGKDGAAPSFPCVVARAPVASALDRGAYEAFSQNAQGEWSWTRELTLATPVLEGSDTALSVGWNAYLNKFLAVHSKYFDNHVVLHTAPSVEGPWQELAEVELAPAKAWTNTNAREHPGLQQRCGKRIIISHWSPTSVNDAGYPNAGETVLSAIDLE